MPSALRSPGAVRYFSVCAALLALVWLIACPLSQADIHHPKLLLVLKGESNAYWRQVYQGAQKAAEEAGVTMLHRSTKDDGDIAGQIQILSYHLSQTPPDVLILAPNSDEDLSASVAQYRTRNIPVLVVDSNLAGNAHQGLVATDNYAAGQLAARALLATLDLSEKRNIVLLRLRAGNASTDQREQGFLDVLMDYDKIRIAAAPYVGDDRGAARSEMLRLLKELPTIDGLFTPNESTTIGALVAIRQSGMSKRFGFIGFDQTEELEAAMYAGEISNLVVQNPEYMGYLAVQRALDLIKGNPIPAFTDTGVKLLQPLPKP
ncbi:substrate-binding domain-containing protein [Hahella aquimaris]|uniref:ABC transporter substrate-binding protein n=1 Tax=Hahella sp. HNIBRBA332 TaxID=3015983 RepID=UPI00273A84FA|nr:substrate-binding domain-containing protein [Hahella sp. HNIBRBA332]WLQ13341.1 substrate-binding domain-containing protein [Hahella sp. HNIBRBA332]